MSVTLPQVLGLFSKAGPEGLNAPIWACSSSDGSRVTSMSLLCHVSSVALFSSPALFLLRMPEQLPFSPLLCRLVTNAGRRPVFHDCNHGTPEVKPKTTPEISEHKSM